jgi:hypothetical protein
LSPRVRMSKTVMRNPCELQCDQRRYTQLFLSAKKDFLYKRNYPSLSVARESPWPFSGLLPTPRDTSRDPAQAEGKRKMPSEVPSDLSLVRVGVREGMDDEPKLYTFGIGGTRDFAENPFCIPP